MTIKRNTLENLDYICAEVDLLTQRVQELEEVLVLAEHKIDQYLQGQYPEGNSLGRILKAIRVTLAGAKESDE